jgi:hypothetical protein
MDYEMLTSFFLWSSIINIALLLFTSLMVKMAGVWIYETHGKWFSVPEDTYLAVVYALIGGYKVLILVFNVVPWVVLEIIG